VKQKLVRNVFLGDSQLEWEEDESGYDDLHEMCGSIPVSHVYQNDVIAI